MCGSLSLGCDVIPAELQVHFKAMCGDRVEHINRRITNYRKVSVRLKPAITLDFVCWFILSSRLLLMDHFHPFSSTSVSASLSAKPPHYIQMCVRGKINDVTECEVGLGLISSQL